MISQAGVLLIIAAAARTDPFLLHPGSVFRKYSYVHQ